MDIWNGAVEGIVDTMPFFAPKPFSACQILAPSLFTKIVVRTFDQTTELDRQELASRTNRRALRRFREMSKCHSAMSESSNGSWLNVH